MNKIFNSLIIAGVIICVACHVVFAKPSIKVFTSEAIIGEVSVATERATSTGHLVDGATTIGFAWTSETGTSAPHIGIGYQTSMDKSTWTATVIVVGDSAVAVYTATDTAFTIHPTQWIRWILRTELLNATDTAVSLWFKASNK